MLGEVRDKCPDNVPVKPDGRRELCRASAQGLDLGSRCRERSAAYPPFHGSTRPLRNVGTMAKNTRRARGREADERDAASRSNRTPHVGYLAPRRVWLDAACPSGLDFYSE